MRERGGNGLHFIQTQSALTAVPHYSTAKSHKVVYVFAPLKASNEHIITSRESQSYPMTRHNEYNQRINQKPRPDITARGTRRAIRCLWIHDYIAKASDQEPRPKSTAGGTRRTMYNYIAQAFDQQSRPDFAARRCAPHHMVSLDISLSRENFRPKTETQFCSPEVLAAPHVVPGYVITSLRTSGSHFRPITLEKRFLRYGTSARVLKSYDGSHTYSATTHDGL